MSSGSRPRTPDQSTGKERTLHDVSDCLIRSVKSGSAHCIHPHTSVQSARPPRWMRARTGQVSSRGGLTSRSHSCLSTPSSNCSGTPPTEYSPPSPPPSVPCSEFCLDEVPPQPEEGPAPPLPMPNPPAPCVTLVCELPLRSSKLGREPEPDPPPTTLMLGRWLCCCWPGAIGEDGVTEVEGMFEEADEEWLASMRVDVVERCEVWLYSRECWGCEEEDWEG